jgi:hypothetical protein
MARFYAGIKGGRGEATRAGTSSSGIQGHIRGWRIGGRVRMWINDNGEDVVYIELTSGSSHTGPPKILFQGTRKDYEEFIDSAACKCDQ